MYNFIYHNPTKLVFGKGQIAQIENLIPKDRKLMLTFGGGSVKQNGVYEQTVKALENHDFIEFWGIEPNPTVETLREAIALAKENKIDFLLAVGGGSVLDGTKLIASALLYNGDPWDIVVRGKADKAIPYASIMTLPATGSEMNSGSVISNTTLQEKRAFGTTFPEFSVLDPESTFTLPKFQIACGVTDAFVHVCEQYMTHTGESLVMDRWAEGVLQTLIEVAPKVLADSKDYDAMSQFMLSATLALNNMIRMGVTQDWATHMIGHELTALHGVTHGASLAIIYPATLRVLKDQKRDKILQYGERIWNVTQGTTDERIEKTIAKTEAFFRSLGLKTRLQEYEIGMETIYNIEHRLEKDRAAYGENQNVNGAKAKEILMECLVDVFKN